MSDTVYVVLTCNQWGDETMIADIYASKEQAERSLIDAGYERVADYRPRWGRYPAEPTFRGERRFREYAVIEPHEVKK